jgi:hypothetical protein
MPFQMQSITGTVRLFNKYNVVGHAFVTDFDDFGAAIRQGGLPAVKRLDGASGKLADR